MANILQFPIRIFVYLIYCLPDSVKGGIAWCIGFFWFDILRIRRKSALENVNRAFPELSAKEKRRMARTSLYHMSLTLLDFASFSFMNKENFGACIEWEGREHLDEAIEKGYGVLAMSAHLGNGDFGAAALAQYGYSVHIISKVFKSQWLNKFWFTSRENLGVRFIPPRKSTYQILKALKRKEVVIFVLDQYTGPPNGVKTQFFGHDTGTAVGLALLTSRSQAPVVPMYTYRTGVNRHVIKIGPPIKFIEKETTEESLQATTQHYNDIIEQWVREHPEQWMWIHRRWKVGFA